VLRKINTTDNFISSVHCFPHLYVLSSAVRILLRRFFSKCIQDKNCDSDIIFGAFQFISDGNRMCNNANNTHSLPHPLSRVFIVMKFLRRNKCNNESRPISLNDNAFLYLNCSLFSVSNPLHVITFSQVTALLTPEIHRHTASFCCSICVYCLIASVEVQLYIRCAFVLQYNRCIEIITESPLSLTLCLLSHS